jgi:hypothetical protein
VDLECRILAKCVFFQTERKRIPQTEDSPADDAVSSEPLSAGNSLIIRENTGNFDDLSLLTAD